MMLLITIGAVLFGIACFAALCLVAGGKALRTMEQIATESKFEVSRAERQRRAREDAEALEAVLKEMYRPDKEESTTFKPQGWYGMHES